MALWEKEDSAAGAPKWLQAEPGQAPHKGPDGGGQVENADAVFPMDLDGAYLVDNDEAQVDANRAKGLRTPGWHVYTTYTDANGNTRNKSECLVAMGDAPVGVVGDDGVTANTDIEDTVVADPTP